MLKLTALLAAATLTLATAAAEAPPAPPSTPYTAPVIQTCDTASFALYFQNAEALLTDQARAVILAARERLKGCEITGVSMIAATEDARTQTERVMLATDRIAIVLTALRDHDLTADTISASLDQASAPVANSAPPQPALARRVAVTLTATHPELG